MSFLFWGIGLTASLLFVPLWLWFFTELTQQESRVSKTLIAVFFVLGLLLSAWCICSGDVEFQNALIGRQFIYKSTPPFVSMIVFYMFSLSFILIYSIRWYRKAVLKRLKKEAKVFIVVLCITAPFTALFDFILPGIFGMYVPPISSILAFVLYKWSQV